MRFAFRELKLVVEPGGAIGLAALLAGKLDVKGKVVVAVLSGGNVDAELFAKIIGESSRPPLLQNRASRSFARNAIKAASGSAAVNSAASSFVARAAARDAPALARSPAPNADAPVRLVAAASARVLAPSGAARAS